MNLPPGNWTPVYAVQLNDSIVAVASTEARAEKIANAVRSSGDRLASGGFSRAVYVRYFLLDLWPEHWAGGPED